MIFMPTVLVLTEDVIDTYRLESSGEVMARIVETVDRASVG